MADRATLIVQAARGSAVERQLEPLVPWEVSGGEVVLNVLPADAHGQLEPPAAVVDAAGHTSRPVILRVMRDG